MEETVQKILREARADSRRRATVVLDEAVSHWGDDAIVQALDEGGILDDMAPIVTDEDARNLGDFAERLANELHPEIDALTHAMNVVSAEATHAWEEDGVI